MARVKRGTMHVKRRKNILSEVKGYRHGRKNLIKLAKTAINKAGQHAFRDRRKKKGVRRALWNVQINAAVRPLGLSYSRFIHALKSKNVELDRKILADLANNNPEVLKKVVEAVK